jgi:hypothetical protein
VFYKSTKMIAFEPFDRHAFFVGVLKFMNLRANVGRNAMAEYLDPDKFVVSNLNEKNFVKIAKYHCAINRGVHVYGFVQNATNIDAIVKFYKTMRVANPKADSVMEDLRATVLEYKRFVESRGVYWFSNNECYHTGSRKESMEASVRDLGRVYEGYDAWILHRSRPIRTACPETLCSICFDEVGSKAVMCGSCSNPIHEVCLNNYKRSLGRDIIPCPTCRRLLA